MWVYKKFASDLVNLFTKQHQILKDISERKRGRCRLFSCYDVIIYF